MIPLKHKFTHFMRLVDYCNSLHYCLPVVHLGKLQRVQNSAARIICNISRSRYDHIMAVLRCLHCLPIEYRISFKVLIITFKEINGAAPEYLSNLINVRKMWKHSLWSNVGIVVELRSVRLKEFLGDRHFHPLLLDVGKSCLWIVEVCALLKN